MALVMPAARTRVACRGKCRLRHVHGYDQSVRAVWAQERQVASGMSGVKRYRTIVADPPWPFRWSGGVGGAHRNPTPMAYDLMVLEEIKELPVAEVAEDDAHLFLWVTPELHRLGEGVATVRAWGFEPVDEIIWEKPNIGVGVFPRHVHEPLLIARRGELSFGGSRNIRSVQKWSQRHAGNGGGKIHSAKPDAALDLIEQVSPGPYLELFARRARFGWDYWGDQSLGTAELRKAAS